MFALAECVVSSPGRLGAVLDLSFASADPEAYLFGEAPSRAIVTLSPADFGALQAAARERGVPCQPLGEVGGPILRADPFISVPVETLLARHLAPIPGL